MNEYWIAKGGRFTDGNLSISIENAYNLVTYHTLRDAMSMMGIKNEKHFKNFRVLVSKLTSVPKNLSRYWR